MGTIEVELYQLFRFFPSFSWTNYSRPGLSANALFLFFFLGLMALTLYRSSDAVLSLIPKLWKFESRGPFFFGT